MQVAPTDVEFDIFSAHRGHDKFSRIIAHVTFNNDREKYPGTLDVLSVEWDPSVATYYSNTASGYATCRDTSKKAKGIVVFNYDDKNCWYDTSMAAVYVTPKKPGSWLDIGSKFTHTYTEKSVKTTETISIGFSLAGPTGGYSYTADTTIVNKAWTRYMDNSFKIQAY